MTITSKLPTSFKPAAQLDANPKLRAGAQASLDDVKRATTDKTSDIPADISSDIGVTTPKKVSTDADGNTVVELHSTNGLKITRVAGEDMCDGGETRWVVSANDGTQRELTDEEKKTLATNLDRNVSGHDMDPKQETLARDMLRELAQDPAIDARWDAPNLLKDVAMSEGKVTSRERYGNGQLLGRQSGPMERLTLTNGNSAEIDVWRESAPNGPGSTPIFSKTIASGPYQHTVKLSREEAMELRDNLTTQGPQYKDTIRDLERYIRSMDPSRSGDTFERTSNRNPYQRYVG